VTLQDAADAFLDQHKLARSTRRVYRAPLDSLVARLGTATAVGELSGPLMAGWFAAATPSRRRIRPQSQPTCERLSNSWSIWARMRSTADSLWGTGVDLLSVSC
jgi:hypothetical protein